MEDIKLNAAGIKSEKDKLPSNVTELKIGEKSYFFKRHHIGWRQLTEEEEYMLKIELKN